MVSSSEHLQPVRIDPDAFYDEGTARLLLGVTAAALSSARSKGALRSVKRGLRTFYKGSWILDWLEGPGAAQESGGGDRG
jgi:hypothetical protein